MCRDMPGPCDPKGTIRHPSDPAPLGRVPNWRTSPGCGTRLWPTQWTGRGGSVSGSPSTINPSARARTEAVVLSLTPSLSKIRRT